MTIRYPYSRQNITPADIEAVNDALRGDYLTQGPGVARFETALARRVGCDAAVSCSNGTAALHLAYMALGLGPDRGLITSPITFLATANAARMTGADVTFVDVNPHTGNLDPEALQTALKRAAGSVFAVAPVHLAGRPCDMDDIRAIAREFGVKIVEDACHALGARYTDGAGVAHPIGDCSHSDLAAFSFHAIKHLAMGEGGAVCGNDKDQAAYMSRLRSHGIRREEFEFADRNEIGPWYYEMSELGFNYRLTDVQCALGLSQLGRLDDSIARRRAIAEFYREHLDGLNHLTGPEIPADPQGHAWHLYALQVDFAALGKNRTQIMSELAARGVGTQVHYIPLYRQPYYARRGALASPGAEQYYAGALSIPMYPQLEPDDLALIVAALRETLRS